MTSGTEQRKLGAIMFTETLGYSALAQRNEAASPRAEPAETAHHEP
jgi:hypothetical protein